MHETPGAASVPDERMVPPRVANPGMSEDAVLRGTGKGWDEWFGLLDAWGGAAQNHTEIARHVADTYEIDGWWAQGVAVGYERARGMRVRHQTPDGFTVSVSKTVPVPATTLCTAFVDAAIRQRWLEPGALRLRTSRPGRSARFDVLLPGGEGTRLEVWFTAKGDAKASAALQHVKLSRPEELEPWRAFWKERLRRLTAMLAAG